MPYNCFPKKFEKRIIYINSLKVEPSCYNLSMITINKAKIKEVFEIKKLLYRTWVNTYKGLYSQEAIDKITSDWHSIELLKKQILDPTRQFLVAKDGNKIVGMCNTDSFEEKENKINIQRLHIDPEYQRQGIGTSLINKIIERFPNLNKIDLEVEKQNKNAISFYQKNGYKIVNEKIFEVQNVQIPCYIMEKTI